MFECPVCNKELEYIESIKNTHITGDEKSFRLKKCIFCSKYYLFIDVDAHVGSGVNYLVFRIDLNEEEAKVIKEIIEKCPDPFNENCKCPAHDYMDSFEMKNVHRRIVIVDDMELW